MAVLFGPVPAAVGAAAVHSAVQSGPVGTAIEVPGTAALNGGGSALVLSVSCPSAGNCVAGGQYRDSAGNADVFVADEVNGVWQKAIEVPGTADLAGYGVARIQSLSCPSAANCVAGGVYFTGPTNGGAFVADEVNGVWQKAIEVPGTGTDFGIDEVNSVSCGSAGNCVAGGDTTDESGNVQAFVADEVNGVWQNAIEVPGTAAVNVGGIAQVLTVSCSSAGDCVAGGWYSDTSGNQGFVADEVNGVWQNAIEVPGKALNTGDSARLFSVSCPSAGNCVAGGDYAGASGGAFVASEVNGVWHHAIEVPGTAALGSAQLFSVSCASAGNCVAAGQYFDGADHTQAFVATEVNGTWHSAIEVPGTATLNTGGSAQVSSVSCASAGNCVAGGFYTYLHGIHQAFVVREVNGHWYNAIKVAANATLSDGRNAEVNSVSCPSAGNCVAGGAYTDSAHHLQAFVTRP
jgi:hypothetical protein